MSTKNANGPLTVGFVATRISGTDGVSLEIEKWSTIIERLGHSCRYVTGETDRRPEHSFVIEEANFHHPRIQAINTRVFGHSLRASEVTDDIQAVARDIKERLYRAIDELQLDLVIAENCLTIPLNIPLGVALVEVILETGLPCIAHHHDFVWERPRFLLNAVPDYLHVAFPPPLSSIDHVVINSLAGREFSRRTGLSARLVPNTMDFANPPPGMDDYTTDFRASIGVAKDELIILQPTRIVQRKGIEHTIELVHRLNDPRYRLVATHGGDDEGQHYTRRVRDYAKLMGVDIVYAEKWISSERARTVNGDKQYAIWDVYPHADLVAYPSSYEGFGNAFLEAVYFGKPIFCNRYAIFRTDIEPYGFHAVVMDGFVTNEVVEEVREILADENRRQAIAAHNYELGRKHFSFEAIEQELKALVERPHPRIP